MSTCKVLGYILLIVSCNFWSKTSSAAECQSDKVLVPMSYQFKDTDVRSTWVYGSLRPTLIVNRSEERSQSQKITDGALVLKFCVRIPKDTNRLTLRIGPRTHDLAVRPITRRADGTNEMSEISLLNQQRPDWVILKSAKRVNPQGSQLPAFDVELFNFGPTHAGGRLQFEAIELGWSCALGTAPTRVEVQVLVAGQRLQVASSDPEYPEELISRPATLDQSINSCAKNFRLQADFGPTGRIPPGPLRIRYGLKGARAKDPKSSEEVISHFKGARAKDDPSEEAISRFFGGVYRITVVGEGIW